LIFTLSKNTFSESAVTYKTGSYEIPVCAYEALEYKLGILKGDTVTIMACDQFNLKKSSVLAYWKRYKNIIK
jgi:hypothetical protein